jgi:hypothetical protein
MPRPGVPVAARRVVSLVDDLDPETLRSTQGRDLVLLGSFSEAQFLTELLLRCLFTSLVLGDAHLGELPLGTHGTFGFSPLRPQFLLG